MDHDDWERLNSLLDRDLELREKIKDQVHELDKKTRIVVGALDKLHSTPGSDIPSLVSRSRLLLHDCRPAVRSLAGLVPENEYWRWCGMWTNSLRAGVFSSILIEYLHSGSLLTQRGVADDLGINDEWSTRFALHAEDYLHGLISVVNEMSRWAVNAVTLGDYHRPIEISQFVKNIFSGFTLLNLKNDMMRKRFDSLKYDIKKIEEVVYDVSLRHLTDS